MASSDRKGMQPSTEGLNCDHLIALRWERWQEVHHLDDLDRRSIVLVVTGVTGVILAQHAVLASFVRAQALVAVLSAILCIGSIYSTVRNRVTMIYAIWTIDYIDVIFNHRQSGLFAYAGNRGAPRSLGAFAKGLLFSIRGSIVLFFAVVLGYSLWLIALPLILLGTQHLYFVHWIAGVIAFFATAALVPWCFFDNWRRARATFDAINASLSQKESVSSTDIVRPRIPTEEAEKVRTRRLPGRTERR